jgi:DNA mismatch endonuclease, patch repair protein
MADFLTPQERSHRMSLIKSKNTKPEKRMASLLRDARIRFRRHRKDLPGKPDFCVLNARVVVFVDGEFWHGKGFEDWSHKLKPFWRDKIQNNIKRDKRVSSRLRNRGWSVVRIWEKDVWRKSDKCVARVLRALAKSGSPTVGT